jgi:hypothetical protein
MNLQEQISRMKTVMEALTPNRLTSPKAKDNIRWSKLFNRLYKLNLPTNGDWTNPEFNKTMERYLKDRGIAIHICSKGDGYCHDDYAGSVTTKDVDSLYAARSKDESVQQTQDAPKDVKVFQDWLDANYPNWLNGRKLNKGRGYGTFGPYTKKAWSQYKSKYKE